MATINDMLHAQHRLNERIANQISKMPDQERLKLAKDKPKEFQRLSREVLVIKPNNAPKPQKHEDVFEVNDNNTRVAARRQILAKLADGEIEQAEADKQLNALHLELQTALKASTQTEEAKSESEVKIHARFNDKGIPLNILAAAKAAASDPGMTSEKAPVLPTNDSEDATVTQAPATPAVATGAPAKVAPVWRP